MLDSGWSTSGSQRRWGQRHSLARSLPGESQQPKRKRKNKLFINVQGDTNASDRELVVCYVSEWGNEGWEHVRGTDDDGERDPNESERRATVGRVDKAGDGIHPAVEGQRCPRFKRSCPWRHSRGDNREGDQRWGIFVFILFLQKLNQNNDFQKLGRITMLSSKP